jgi:hypothetical protein
MNEKPTGQNRFTYFSTNQYSESKLYNKVPFYYIFESIDDSIISFQKKIHRSDPQGLDSFFHDPCECYKCEKL